MAYLCRSVLHLGFSPGLQLLNMHSWFLRRMLGFSQKHGKISAALTFRMKHENPAHLMPTTFERITVSTFRPEAVRIWTCASAGSIRPLETEAVGTVFVPSTQHFAVESSVLS